MNTEVLEKEILAATVTLYNRSGLGFTMDDLAKELHRSKKTIYRIFPDRIALMDAVVDYVFDSIGESKRSAAGDGSRSSAHGPSGAEETVHMDTGADQNAGPCAGTQNETGGDTVWQLRRVLGAMPEEYQTVEFQKLYVLKEKYPTVYAHVERRLESGWEETISLLEKGMREGTIRKISVPVFKTMFQSTLEQFFQQDVLIENGISYGDALREVVDIMIDGICVKS